MSTPNREYMMKQIRTWSDDKLASELANPKRAEAFRGGDYDLLFADALSRILRKISLLSLLERP